MKISDSTFAIAVFICGYLYILMELAPYFSGALWIP